MDNFTNVCEATSQSLDLDTIRPTHRKGKKLLAEKKRRARINNCLMKIRQLVCAGQEENDTDLDKMEKAEILEKTLEVLTRIRHDGSKNSNIISTRKAMAIRYASGFSSCAEESIRYIQNSRLVPSEVKLQLQNHLRAIARRMESIVQVDYQGLNYTQIFSTSSSSSSSAMLGMISNDANSSSVVERVSVQLPSDVSEDGSYYIASPLCCSTPLVHHQLPLMTSNSLEQQEEQLIKLTSETHMKKTCDHNITSAEKYTGHTSDTPVRKKSMGEHIFTSDSESVCDQPDMYSPESNYISHSSLSCESTNSQSKLSIHGVLSSVNSPIFLHPSHSLPATPIPPYRTTYTYQGYEPYPITPSILDQSTQLRSCSSIASNIVKQARTSSNIFDTCAKRAENQQISPETMWRPW